VLRRWAALGLVTGVLVAGSACSARSPVAAGGSARPSASGTSGPAVHPGSVGLAAGLSRADTAEASRLALASPLVIAIAGGVAMSVQNTIPDTYSAVLPPYRGAVVLIRFAHPVTFPTGMPVWKDFGEAGRDANLPQVPVGELLTTYRGPAMRIRTLGVALNLATAAVLALAPDEPTTPS